MRLFRREDTVAKVMRRRCLMLLLHSTHLYRNLTQILEDGSLQTVRTLKEKHGVNAAARFLHDPFRYETFVTGLDYLNASLSVPNAELLYHRSRSDWKSEWVHLALDLSLMTREDTLFSPLNAAYELGHHVQKGADGLKAMFAETVRDNKRGDLPENIPTHPQAEVLVRGPLALSAVRSIIVADAATGSEVERLCEQHTRKIKVQVLPYLFVWPKRLMK
jgi:hypothetical protein